MFAARNMMFAGVSAAGAYIAAVETALGSSITSTQKDALNAFVLAEQAAGRWTSHKRLYLPIWANAAANAICLKSLASGTFAGTVTHGAGYVQGDGSTGYFNFGTSPLTQGLTASSAFFGLLIRQAESRGGANYTPMGSDGPDVRANLISHINYNGQTAVRCSSVASVMHSPDNMSKVGIFCVGSTATNARYFRVRRTAGVQASASNTTSDATTPSTSSMTLMAGNRSGAYSEHSNARIGAAFMGLALSTSAADAFTLNLKTLWETCTGLTLP